ncbi:hypothetical protein AWC69_04430 [Listeria monocytogenes]|uniref:hypothetical protein n=1 Tax=Listeria monocytogenes TaxID=1639 RepID=UPI0008759B49|nr:hypothetical protein [Listeria monocytogenes]EAD0598061.1 hypothetical protein [Listeria monocytogenes]EAF9833078.1 hypothetical protein [Listeria monocytogenes]EIN7679226.1 hypothetical protein [Listeria monocytogenes]OFH47932.1 hypothetical protein BJN05_07200 [Listeria monocytogenes]TYU13916.1 hypothetical protein FZW82_03395 [Listeria monocytogenes]
MTITRSEFKGYVYQQQVLSFFISIMDAKRDIREIEAEHIVELLDMIDLEIDWDRIYNSFCIYMDISIIEQYEKSSRQLMKIKL